MAVGALCGLAAVSSATAEDTKGKWQFGFGLSYFSTTDYIRSNADVAISDGTVDENGLPSVRSVDERPDINILNEPTIQDDFRIDFNASYGLTRWLAVEAAVGYYKGPVGDIEYFNHDRFRGVGVSPADTTAFTCGPDLNARCYEFTPNTSSLEVRINRFLPVGEITEIPVNLSALVRFRPESPFDPYIGLGAGYIFTNLKTGEEFNEISDLTEGLRVVSASVGEITQQSCNPLEDPEHCKLAESPGFAPIPLQASVKNAFEWHAVGGVDYYLNERFSVFVDARYIWTGGQVDIRIDDVHQVRFGVEDQGQLVLMRKGSIESPFLWEDTGFWDRVNDRPSGITCQYPDPENPGQTKSCVGDGLFATEEKGPCVNGELDTACLPPGADVPINEDDGVITLLPAGSFDFGEMVGTFICEDCIGNGGPYPDSEDRNDNQILDRFLKYGEDLCSRPEAAGNPICSDPARRSAVPRYVWPAGCPTSSLQTAVGDRRGKDEGCPPIPAAGSGLSQTSGGDDESDVYLIQGGRIRLGGFSLGVGFKFTF
jgi:opacity protein-like surface antigen